MKIIKSNNYQILISNLINTNFDFSKYSKIAILTDENTYTHCLPLLIQNISSLKKANIIQISSGEKNKNLKTCNYIWTKLLKFNFDKNSLLVNLGGGMICDIGGFCASTFKRGVEFIQIPTTLLAMTDASVGGKLAIDFMQVKNCIGLICNPKSVLIYPSFLKTLSKESLAIGFTEVIKHALIDDKKLWTYIYNTNFIELDWSKVINRSLEIKNRIVINDPYEKGIRKKLNFGHTFGHAIESYFLNENNPIEHGQAVALGILLEIKLSKLTKIEKKQIISLITKNIPLPEQPSKNNLLHFMKYDKKNINNKINFSLLDGIGKCTIDNLFEANEL